MREVIIQGMMNMKKKNDPEWKDYKGLFYPVGSDTKDSIKLGEITDEDVSAVNDIISRAKPYLRGVYPGEDFYSIIDEETGRFFKGGCTAEECADAMQSRLEIYLSEHFG